MASQHRLTRYKNMTVEIGDLVVNGTTSGGLAGTTVLDDAEFLLGTDEDAALLWSTGDASNEALVLALGNTSQAVHVTDYGAKATDWNVSGLTHPTVFVHSNTTPATDYMTVGGHDGTTGAIDVVGGTTLALKIAGTAVGLINANGMQVRTAGEAVTATTGGGTTGLITAGSSFVVVTSDSADKQISLPAASVGDRIRILVGATGCELISAVATHKVNDVTVGATNEAALTATSMYDCQYLATDTWIVVGYTKLGAVQAALVPDSL